MVSAVPPYTQRGWWGDVRPGPREHRGEAAGTVRDGFADWLAAQGFASDTVRGYLRWLGWLSDWLAARALDGRAVTDDVAAAFAADMRAAGRSKITAGRLASAVVSAELGAVPEAVPAPLTGRQRMLAEFRCYLEGRGLAPGRSPSGCGCRAVPGRPGLRGRPPPEPGARQVLDVVRSWARWRAALQPAAVVPAVPADDRARRAGRDRAFPPVRKAAGTRRAARLTPAQAGGAHLRRRRG